MVEKPGAAYAIAAVSVAKATPDGHILIATELGMFTSQHQINADVQDVIRDAAFQAKVLDASVLQPILGTPQAFAAYLAAESKKWEKVIKGAGLKLE